VVLEVRRWAEIRRMREVDGLSIREIAKRTGHDRNTVRRALRREGPPRYERPPRPSKLDPFKDEIHRLLQDDPGIPGRRVLELLWELGFTGSKTIVDDYLRELRPLFAPRRTYQRTIYRPGELCQFDLFEPRLEIPVGHGQTRRAWLVTAELGYSRALAGALVFSKEAPELLFGMGRCLARLGALPERLVWDREGAIHAGGGRPTDAFAGFCGVLRVGWLILEARDPEAKGALERSHRSCARASSRAARSPTSSTTKPSSTPGARGPTGASTARCAAGRQSGWPRNASGCGRCRPPCRTPIAAS
jgi:transposase